MNIEDLFTLKDKTALVGPMAEHPGFGSVAGGDSGPERDVDDA